MRTVRLAGLLLGLGFIGVVLWTVAFLVANPPRSDTQSQTTAFYWVATTAGYGLAGFAGWRWTVRNVGDAEGARRVRGPSRWMAAASLVTAAGVAALTYQLHAGHALFADQPHYTLRLLGDIAGTAGFVLAAVGFWIVSSMVPPAPVKDEHAARVPSEV